MNAPTFDPNLSKAQDLLNQLRKEISQHIIGQEQLIERLLVTIFSAGHLLLEGVPGLAKTRTLSVLSQLIDGQLSRIQFTPDLLPSDLIGTEVYRPQSGDFSVRKGPIFANILLADEINRAPAKVQSALLQAMQEHQVTIGEHTFSLPEPFMVLATQNPIEQEGTYRLPEAQLDRFLMKVEVTYPSLEEELRVVELVSKPSGENPVITPVLSLAQIGELRKIAANLYCDTKIDRYIVSLVHATRNASAYGLSGMIEWGASPRASIALKIGARTLAFLRGKTFVTPDEVKALAPDVLRHRILPSFDAEARSLTSNALIETLLRSVPTP
jgi:MoxR-like ATPase